MKKNSIIDPARLHCGFLPTLVFLFTVFGNLDGRTVSVVNAQGKTVEISGQWFLSHRIGENNKIDVNEFYVHRGYLNFKPEFTSALSARITPDITTDKDGDGKGDLKVWLKYIYLKYSLPSAGFFTKPYFEFGQVHRPWLDFEEHINMYRCEGTMFLERNHLLNSADYGVTFVTLLGGEVKKTYRENVNKYYPGRYGSIAVGIYNGGGYHAVENNTNKVVESRFTIRPFPDSLPGLQLSYFGAIGKGNTVDEPDWTINSAFVSLEEVWYVLTGMYYKGKGNYKGDFIDSFGNSTEQSGYSLFGEIKIPEKKISFIGRYDSFDPDITINQNTLTRTIIGFAYHFHEHHKLLVDYDCAKQNSGTITQSSFVKTTIEVHF